MHFLGSSDLTKNGMPPNQLIIFLLIFFLELKEAGKLVSQTLAYLMKNIKVIGLQHNYAQTPLLNKKDLDHSKTLSHFLFWFVLPLSSALSCETHTHTHKKIMPEHAIQLTC